MDAFLSGGFYAASVSAGAKEPLQDFTIFRNHLPSLQRRNQRLQLRRLSVHADLLKDRVSAKGISFDDLMQADLVLYLRAVAPAVKDRKAQIWWPETLVWSSRQYVPFEIFARAQSMKYFRRISNMLGVADRDEFVTVVTQLVRGQARNLSPRWEADYVPLEEVTGATKLGTIA